MLKVANKFQVRHHSLERIFFNVKSVCNVKKRCVNHLLVYTSQKHKHVEVLVDGIVLIPAAVYVVKQDSHRK